MDQDIEACLGEYCRPLSVPPPEPMTPVNSPPYDMAPETLWCDTAGGGMPLFPVTPQFRATVPFVEQLRVTLHASNDSLEPDPKCFPRISPDKTLHRHEALPPDECAMMGESGPSSPVHPPESPPPTSEAKVLDMPSEGRKRQPEKPAMPVAAAQPMPLAASPRAKRKRRPVQRFVPT